VRIGILLVVLLALEAACARSGPQPVFCQDLRSWRFATDATDVAGNYTDVNFLTDNLVLVNTATEREFASEPLVTDIPSKLLLFDLSTGKLVKTVDLPIEKWSQSVRSTRNGRFVVLNLSGVQACSVDLTCGLPVSTVGPLLVSPGGARLLVGGDGQSERKVLDSITLKELDHFSTSVGPVQIGDSALLVDSDQITVTASAKPQYSFFSTDAKAQFLSDRTLAGYASRMDQPDRVVVRRLDGSVMYEIVLQAHHYETQFITSISGIRFCVDELGYNW
jgi:hypothetical protein